MVQAFFEYHGNTVFCSRITDEFDMYIDNVGKVISFKMVELSRYFRISMHLCPFVRHDLPQMFDKNLHLNAHMSVYCVMKVLKTHVSELAASSRSRIGSCGAGLCMYHKIGSLFSTSFLMYYCILRT